MFKRRQFLAGISALAGSYVLAGCGGDNPVAGAGAGVAAKAVAKEMVAGSPAASQNGATIPSAGSIVDYQGATWTLVNGVVFRNGATVGDTYNVSLILWFQGNIWHCGSGVFFMYVSGSWIQSTDPRLGVVSADNANVFATGYLMDKSLNVWSIQNDAVTQNGLAAGTTYNVSNLLWFGGRIYHVGTNQYFVFTFNNEWKPTSDPRVSPTAMPGGFYGINGHFDYPFSPSQLVSILQGLGCTTYRVGTTADSSQLYRLIQIAPALQAAGIQMFVVILQGLRDGSGNLFADTATAYSTARATGVTVASTLGPYGVSLYECGNELTRDDAIIIDSNYAGTKRTDFDNANWPIMREVMRGMMDGVRAAQAGAKCGINFCVADVAAADDLWDGVQPDGSSGYDLARWDFTTWHNYEVYGDIFDIGTDGAGPGFDLPAYCKARFGVPFLISEWNASPEKDENYRAAYITQHMGEFYANRVSHGIESVMYYELDSNNDTWGIIMDDGSQISPSYGAFQSFVATHPDR